MSGCDVGRGRYADDATLCRRAQAGDVEAEGEMVGRYQHLAAQAANRAVCIGIDERGDLYAVGLKAVLASVRAYSNDLGTFEAYARRAIKNALIDRARDSHRHDVPKDLLFDQGLDSVEESFGDTRSDADFRSALIRESLDRLYPLLDPFEKRVFGLLGQYGTPEISVKLKCSRSTVWRAVVRIREAAREIGMEVGLTE